jgi:hypothetical protein
MKNSMRTLATLGRNLFTLGFLSLTLFFTVATSPAPGPNPNGGNGEEEDTNPCGVDLETKEVRVFQGGTYLADGDRVNITVGNPQGGAGEEGIDVFIHLDGVRSDEATIGDLELIFYDDQGGTIVSHMDTDSFGCFGGTFRTREINMPLTRSSFELDGMEGSLEVSVVVDGNTVSATQTVLY